ncbi:putative protein of unknown function (DUF4496) [Blattamonas nauphoetae]|uniref:CCDC81 HU domain-containing protein n=1 Tax=Blattamonas nauphoetae TaxID=2049346 RepID=A0ABQ9YGK0_9EUKA|nr:putative protein of unknown function (DUF4496) [Blattamonas nauphoetae]
MTYGVEQIAQLASKHSSPITASDMIGMWNGCSAFLKSTMDNGKGVTYPEFGVFTFQVDQLNVGNLGSQCNSIPLFKLNSSFAASHGIHIRHPLQHTQNVTNVILNFAAVGSYCGLTREQANIAYKHFIIGLGEAIHLKYPIRLSFGIAILTVRPGNTEARMSFVGTESFGKTRTYAHTEDLPKNRSFRTTGSNIDEMRDEYVRTHGGDPTKTRTMERPRTATVRKTGRYEFTPTIPTDFGPKAQSRRMTYRTVYDDPRPLSLTKDEMEDMKVRETLARKGITADTSQTLRKVMARPRSAVTRVPDYSTYAASANANNTSTTNSGGPEIDRSSIAFGRLRDEAHATMRSRGINVREFQASQSLNRRPQTAIDNTTRNLTDRDRAPPAKTQNFTGSRTMTRTAKEIDPAEFGSSLRVQQAPIAQRPQSARPNAQTRTNYDAWTVADAQQQSPAVFSRVRPVTATVTRPVEPAVSEPAPSPAATTRQLDPTICRICKRFSRFLPQPNLCSMCIARQRQIADHKTQKLREEEDKKVEHANAVERERWGKEREDEERLHGLDERRLMDSTNYATMQRKAEIMTQPWGNTTESLKQTLSVQERKYVGAGFADKTQPDKEGETGVNPLLATGLVECGDVFETREAEDAAERLIARERLNAARRKQINENKELKEKERKEEEEYGRRYAEYENEKKRELEERAIADKLARQEEQRTILRRQMAEPKGRLPASFPTGADAITINEPTPEELHAQKLEQQEVNRRYLGREIAAKKKAAEDERARDIEWDEKKNQAVKEDQDRQIQEHLNQIKTIQRQQADALRKQMEASKNKPWNGPVGYDDNGDPFTHQESAEEVQKRKLETQRKQALAYRNQFADRKRRRDEEDEEERRDAELQREADLRDIEAAKKQDEEHAAYTRSYGADVAAQIDAQAALRRQRMLKEKELYATGLEIGEAPDPIDVERPWYRKPKLTKLDRIKVGF